LDKKVGQKKGMAMMSLALRNDSVQNLVNIIKSKMDESAFNAWIEPLKISQNENKVILTAASRFNADFIRATYWHVLSEAAKESNIGIELDAARQNLRVIENPANIDRPSAETSEITPAAFDDFIPSEANQFALSAVKKCASGVASFSPLVIYGPTGSGKSMLLELLAKNTKMRTVVTSGAEFVTDFFRALNTKSTLAFKGTMRDCDLFIIDNVQGLAGKKESSKEFMALIEDLIRQKKNVVISSNISPSRIAGFDPHLVSLLASGLSVDLTAPDSSVREKILVKSGLHEKLAKSIAARTPANGHILSGVLKKIDAWRELDCGALDEQVLEKLLGDVLVKQTTPLCRVKKMCAKLGVAFDDVMAATRTRAIVFARQKIMFVLKSSTGLTLAEIGRVVGGRDHASVLYALSQIEKVKQTDLLLDAELKELAE